MIDLCSSVDSMSVPEFIGDVDETKRNPQSSTRGDSSVVPDMLVVKIVPGGFGDDFSVKDHHTSEDDTVAISDVESQTGKSPSETEDRIHDETAPVVTPEKSTTTIETQPPSETTCIDLDALMDAAMESNGTSTEPIDSCKVATQSYEEAALLPATESNELNTQEAEILDQDVPLPLEVSCVSSGEPKTTETIDFDDEMLGAVLADENEALEDVHPALLEEQNGIESTTTDPALSDDGMVSETTNEHLSQETPTARSVENLMVIEPEETPGEFVDEEPEGIATGNAEATNPEGTPGGFADEGPFKNSEATKPEDTPGGFVDEEPVGIVTEAPSAIIEVQDISESTKDRLDTLGNQTKEHGGLLGTIIESGQQRDPENSIIENGTEYVIVEEEENLACVSDSLEENCALMNDGEEIVFDCDTSESPAVNEEGEAVIRFDLIDSFECMAAEAEAELDALLKTPSSSEEPKTPETKSSKPEPASIVSKRTEAKKKGKQRLVVPHRTPPIRQWSTPTNLFQVPTTPSTDGTTPPKRKMREPIFKDFRPTVPVPFRLRTEERFLARNCPCCAHKKKPSPISVVTATTHSIQPTQLTKKY